MDMRNLTRLVKLAVLSLLIALTLTLASPAYACACDGTVEQFVAGFNSLPDDTRAQANMIPPAGYVFAEDYSLVPLSYYDY